MFPSMLIALAQSVSVPRDPVLWGFVIATIATAFVFFKARRNTRKDPLSGPPPFSSLASQRRIENQMSELLVELEKMSRQMNAQLETRAAKLEELIRQADERLGLLDQKLEDLRQAHGDPDTFRDSVSLDAPPPRPTKPPSRIPPPSTRLDDTAREDISDPPPHPSTGPIPIDPRHATVYHLADQGRSAMEISREVNQPANEVELILALRRRAR